ncbi:MAG: ABC transporter permease [Ruminococcus sp.]|nr:ABC transporter permease [Ruminococcus sp.]
MDSERITYIEAKRKWFSIDFGELWRYRDLIILFVKRNISVSYKQTILGPLWILINPLLSTTVFTVIFGVIAGISTDGMPQFLFYMSGNVLWGFFSGCLNRGSSTFLGNARLFGKVYFPRLVTPISDIIYSFFNYLIQMLAFVGLVIFFALTNDAVRPNLTLLAVPLMVLQTAFLGTGVGLIISSITTKYRDLHILVSFGVSLWMYITPVVYPVSRIPQWLKGLFMLNPVAPIIESYRHAFLGCGSFEWFYWLVSLGVTAVVVLFGLIVFNKVEKNFIDTV